MIIQEMHTMLMNRLIADVRKVCDLYLGSITSFGRSVEHNRLVGGSDTSWHLDWLACDIQIDAGIRKVLNSKEIETNLIKSGYRLTDIPGNKGLHVQYNWPIIRNFDRSDIYTHLLVVMTKYPEIIYE